MLSAAEKAEVRAMVLGIMDNWLEEGYWPAVDESRQFDAALWSPGPGTAPRWGVAEVRGTEDAFYERHGCKSAVRLEFGTWEAGSRKFIHVFYLGEKPLASEMLWVDRLVWTRLRTTPPA